MESSASEDDIKPLRRKYRIGLRKKPPRRSRSVHARSDIQQRHKYPSRQSSHRLSEQMTSSAAEMSHDETKITDATDISSSQCSAPAKAGHISHNGSRVSTWGGVTIQGPKHAIISHGLPSNSTRHYTTGSSTPTHNEESDTSSSSHHCGTRLTTSDELSNIEHADRHTNAVLPSLPTRSLHDKIKGLIRRTSFTSVRNESHRKKSDVSTPISERKKSKSLAKSNRVSRHSEPHNLIKAGHHRPELQLHGSPQECSSGQQAGLPTMAQDTRNLSRATQKENLCSGFQSRKSSVSSVTRSVHTHARPSYSYTLSKSLSSKASPKEGASYRTRAHTNFSASATESETHHAQEQAASAPATVAQFNKIPDMRMVKSGIAKLMEHLPSDSSSEGTEIIRLAKSIRLPKADIAKSHAPTHNHTSNCVAATTLQRARSHDHGVPSEPHTHEVPSEPHMDAIQLYTVMDATQSHTLGLVPQPQTDADPHKGSLPTALATATRSPLSVSDLKIEDENLRSSYTRDRPSLEKLCTMVEMEKPSRRRRRSTSHMKLYGHQRGGVRRTFIVSTPSPPEKRPKRSFSVRCRVTRESEVDSSPREAGVDSSPREAEVDSSPSHCTPPDNGTPCGTHSGSFSVAAPSASGKRRRSSVKSCAQHAHKPSKKRNLTEKSPCEATLFDASCKNSSPTRCRDNRAHSSMVSPSPSPPLCARPGRAKNHRFSVRSSLSQPPTRKGRHCKPASVSDTCRGASPGQAPTSPCRSRAHSACRSGIHRYILPDTPPKPTPSDSNAGARCAPSTSVGQDCSRNICTAKRCAPDTMSQTTQRSPSASPTPHARRSRGKKRRASVASSNSHSQPPPQRLIRSRFGGGASECGSPPRDRTASVCRSPSPSPAPHRRTLSTCRGGIHRYLPSPSPKPRAPDIHAPVCRSPSPAPRCRALSACRGGIHRYMPSPSPKPRAPDTHAAPHSMPDTCTNAGPHRVPSTHADSRWASDTYKRRPLKRSVVEFAPDFLRARGRRRTWTKDNKRTHKHSRYRPREGSYDSCSHFSDYTDSYAPSETCHASSKFTSYRYDAALTSGRSRAEESQCSDWMSCTDSYTSSKTCYTSVSSGAFSDHTSGRSCADQSRYSEWSFTSDVSPPKYAPSIRRRSGRSTKRARHTKRAMTPYLARGRYCGGNRNTRTRNFARAVRFVPHVDGNRNDRRKKKMKLRRTLTPYFPRRNEKISTRDTIASRTAMPTPKPRKRAGTPFRRRRNRRISTKSRDPRDEPRTCRRCGRRKTSMRRSRERQRNKRREVARAVTTEKARRSKSEGAPRYVVCHESVHA